MVVVKPALFSTSLPLMCKAGESSQVLSQIVDLIQDKVHVLPADLRTDDDHPEEVGLFSVWLVAHHHAALLHHALFDHRCHLQEEGGNTAMTGTKQTGGFGHRQILECHF